MDSNEELLNKNKWMIYFLVAIICILVLMGLSMLWFETLRQFEANKNVIVIEGYTLINHKILRDYREWDNDEVSSIGLEVLVNERDATKENIVNLVNYLSLVNEAPNIVIKIYQDNRAWEEVKSGNYTEIYDRGYLACYFKKVIYNGNNKGQNEILWLQEKGNLEYLSGTTTEIQ